MPPIVWVLILCAILGGVSTWQIRNNGKLQERLTAAELERSNAETERLRVVEANRVQAKQLAAARSQADATVRAIAKVPDDDCLGRDLPAGIVDALRLPDGKGKARPPAGRPKAAPGDEGKDVP